MEIEMGEKEGGEQITFITAFLEVKNSQTWNNGVCVCVCVCVCEGWSIIDAALCGKFQDCFG